MHASIVCRMTIDISVERLYTTRKKILKKLLHANEEHKKNLKSFDHAGNEHKLLDFTEY